MPVEGGEAQRLTEPRGGRGRGGLVAGRHADRLRGAACATRPTRKRTTRGAGRGASRGSSTSSTARAGRPTGGSTSSSSRPTARPSRSSSPTATSRTNRRRWSPDGKRIAFSSARHDDWDIEMVSDVYLVDADGGEPRAADAGRRVAAGALLVAGRDADRLPVRPRRLGRPPARPDRRRRPGHAASCTLLTESLDRNCAPYPGIREPLWDEGTSLFVAEDRRAQPVYRVAADGSGSPEPELRERVVTGSISTARRRHAACHAATHADAGRPRSTSAGRRLTEVERGLRRAPSRWSSPSGSRPSRRTAVRGRRLDHAARRLRAGQAVPDPAQHPRRALLPVRRRVLRRVPGVRGAGYAVVYATPAARPGYSEEWGRAIRGPVDGGRGWGSRRLRRLMAVVDEAVPRASTSSTRTGSACSAAPTAAT